MPAALRTNGVSVDVRALREGSAGIVRIDATDDVRACDATLSRWD
jgi:hypothetical protein